MALAPAAEPSEELLSTLGSNLGDVLLVERNQGNPDPAFHNLGRHHVPPAAFPLDIEFTWLSLITGTLASSTNVGIALTPAADSTASVRSLLPVTPTNPSFFVDTSNAASPRSTKAM